MSCSSDPHITATPTAPVTSAVATSMVVRETRARSLMRQSPRALARSLRDEPAFFLVQLAGAHLVLVDELLELIARHEAPGLRRVLEVLLPLGRFGHLLHDADPE